MFWWFLVAATLIALLAVAVALAVDVLIENLRRDQFRDLPKILMRAKSGRNNRGSTVLSIGDRNWQSAVHAAIEVMDLCIVDVSSMSASIEWEIKEATELGVPIIFIARADTTDLDGGLRALTAHLRKTLSRDVSSDEILLYPIRRTTRAAEHAFRLALTGRVFAMASPPPESPRA